MYSVASQRQLVFVLLHGLAEGQSSVTAEVQPQGSDSLVDFAKPLHLPRFGLHPRVSTLHLFQKRSVVLQLGQQVLGRPHHFGESAFRVVLLLENFKLLRPFREYASKRDV